MYPNNYSYLFGKYLRFILYRLKGDKPNCMKKRKKEPYEKPIWYKLDLSAIVYPTLQRKDFSSVYRLSVLLTEEINPVLLQKALNMTLKRFPTYNVAMRRGLFWRYLEPNHRPGPFVQKDIRNFCMPMSFHTEGRYLIRVYYFKNRISLEAHHSLGDGNGGMCLLNTLTASYLTLCGHPIQPGNTVLDISQPPDSEELEDAYMKYSNAKVKPSRPAEKAYLVHGTKEPIHTFNVINGILPVQDVKRVAASYHATITEYFNAALLYALLEKQKNEFHLKLRPVKLAMPINLRRFFPSSTLRNFITMIYPSADPRLGDYSFEELVRHVHNYMNYYIEEKTLRGDITTNAAAQRNPFARIMPLFIKDFVVRTFYAKVQDKNSSAGLTNMGVLKIPPSMEPYVSRYDIYMGVPFSSRTNCAIISYKDTLTVNFASCIVETDIERNFFRKLVMDGIPVTIETNRE